MNNNSKCSAIIGRILCLVLLFSPVSILDAKPQEETRITLNHHNVPLETVIDDIREQSEYLFANKDVDLQTLVSINVKEKKIVEVCEALFTPLEVAYKIQGHHIILSQKTEPDPVEITGTVVDSQGDPLPGVAVLISGTGNGSVTDLDGKFQLEVTSRNQFLEVTCLGYKTLHLPVGDRSRFRIVMEEESVALEGTVVTALACRIAKVMDSPIRFEQGTITTLNLDFAPSTAPLAINKDDFETFNQEIQFTGYTKDFISLDGWSMSNSAANSSFIGLNHIAPTLSGKSLAPGVLTSPLLAKGCSILTFKYGVFASVNDKLSFRVEVLNEAGDVTWTKNVTELEPIYKNGYDFSETVNVAGPFRLRFTNLCPTGASYHKDCVSLYDMSWTNME